MMDQDKRASNKERYYTLKARGLCVRCGRPAMPGKIYCPECRERQNEKSRHRYREYQGDIDTRRQALIQRDSLSRMPEAVRLSQVEEAKRDLKIGDYYKGGVVIGKYRHVFRVEKASGVTECFRYIDLLCKNIPELWGREEE